MRSLARGLLALGLLLCISAAAPLQPLSAHSESQSATGELQPAPGQLIAPVARQAGVLNLDAPRPRLLTSLDAPLYVADLDASSSASLVLAVRDPSGGDLLLLDGESSPARPLLKRADASESFGAPVWSPDASRVVYEREDLRSAPVAYTGQASVRYSTRVERIHVDGSGREVLVDDARQPGLSLDSAMLAYVRSSSRGTVLHVVAAGEDHALTQEERFADLAYPRFSPAGDRIAFAAVGPNAAIGQDRPAWFGLLTTAVAEAHGLPWDIWLIQPDGSGLREVAALGADDPSLAWSPDGSQLFVYGGNGAFIVDATTGEMLSYSHLSGYGSVAWVP